MQKDTKERCKQMVHSAGTSVQYHRCLRFARKDGYCNLHHPSAENARREKANQRWLSKREKDPLFLAHKRIERLEEQVAKLQMQLKTRANPQKCLRCGATAEWLA